MKLDPDNKKCRDAYRKAKRCEELKEKGNMDLKLNKYDDAVKCYTEALELDPYNTKMNSVIYANRGLVLSKQKKTDDALRDFDKSIELNPSYYKAYLRRGETRNSIGDFDSAGMDYKKVMELDPQQS